MNKTLTLADKLKEDLVGRYFRPKKFKSSKDSHIRNSYYSITSVNTKKGIIVANLYYPVGLIKVEEQKISVKYLEDCEILTEIEVCNINKKYSGKPISLARDDTRLTIQQILRSASWY